MPFPASSLAQPLDMPYWSSQCATCMKSAVWQATHAYTKSKTSPNVALISIAQKHTRCQGPNAGMATLVGHNFVRAIACSAALHNMYSTRCAASQKMSGMAV
jgi:hypothetical protein